MKRLIALTILLASAATAQELAVNMRSARYTLEIENSGRVDISGQEITIYINGHISAGYSGTYIGPPRGKKITIRLADLIRQKDGARFNPDQYAITRAYIHCGGKEIGAYNFK